MHNNYYFLRHLSPALEKVLRGFTLVSCFCQNKDELILEFNDSKQSFFIKATLLPDFQCLSFPSTFHRARKNSIDLFSEILMLRVVGVRQFQNERSFALLLDGDNALVFKMHSRQANILLFKGQGVTKIFRNNFTADANLNLGSLDRTIDWSYEYFVTHQADIEKTYFTFGKPVWNFLQSLGFEKAKPEERWRLIQRTLGIMDSPDFTIIEQESGAQLTVLPVKSVFKVFSNPIEALNTFFHHYSKQSTLHKGKVALLSLVRGSIKQAQGFIEKIRDRLATVETDHPYQQWADLIMANLSKIRTGDATAHLADFHDATKTVTIKLKRELSPQKNAAAYYRKAKNRNVEVSTLKDTLVRKEMELTVLIQKEKEILASTGTESLLAITGEFTRKVKDKATQQAHPYHEHAWNGFRIWVGKNAKANDELTLRHSYKEDMWLHAKDVAGSHVVIKYQAGKPFPKDVIERAAQLAAYHSKRKNESLCPVTLAKAKYVRKRKGDPAGVVVVEREEVILVEPRK